MHHGPVQNRHQAWVLLVVAILACAVTMFVVSLFDPFGQQGARVDEAVRRVAAVNLCITYRAYSTRLVNLSPLERVRDPGLVRVLEKGLAELRVAQQLIGVKCDGTILSRATPPATTN